MAVIVNKDDRKNVIDQQQSLTSISSIILVHVHVFDRVLLPLFDNIIQIASILICISRINCLNVPFDVKNLTKSSCSTALTSRLNLSKLVALFLIPSLRDILLYHVIGDFILFAKKGEPITTLKFDHQKLKVVAQDVKAYNGVAHVIATVLVPLCDIIYQITTRFDRFSLLIKLVNEENIAKPLMSGPGPFQSCLTEKRPSVSVFFICLILNVINLF